MKYSATLVLLFFVLFFSSCEKELHDEPEIPLAQNIIGDWQVVYQKNKSNDFTFQDHHEGIVTEWGCYYIESLHIDSDGSYYINSSHTQLQADSSLHPMGGYWELHEDVDKISFHCPETADGLQMGGIHSVTFHIYIDKAGNLVLDNELLHLKHHKKH